MTLAVKFQCDIQDETFSRSELFQSITEFLNQLKARQLDLDILEAKMMPLSLACPDFISEEYLPQLQLTLHSACVLTLTNCTEWDTISLDQATVPNNEAKTKTLACLYGCFLENALELFKLLEDAAYALLSKSGGFRTKPQQENDKEQIDQILTDMENSIRTHSKKLETVKESFPDSANNGHYREQFDGAHGVGVNSLQVVPNKQLVSPSPSSHKISTHPKNIPKP